MSAGPLRIVVCGGKCLTEQLMFCSPLAAEAIAPTLAALYEKSRGALTELARGLRRLVYIPFSGPKISDGGGMQDRVELKAMRGEEPLSSNARKLIWMGQSSRKRAKERGRSLEKVEDSCSATWMDRSKKGVEEILDESYLSSESTGDEGQEGFIVHPLAWGSKSRGDEGQEGFRIHPLACGSKSLRKLKDSLDKVCSHRGAAFSRGETLWSLAKVENSCSATWTDRSNKRVEEILFKAYMSSESSGDEGQEGLRIHPLAWGSKSLRKLKDSIDKVCPHRGAAREPADDVEQAGTRGRPRTGNQKEKEPEAGRQFNRLKYGELTDGHCVFLRTVDLRYVELSPNGDYVQKEEFEAFCDIDAGEECTGDPTEEEFSQKFARLQLTKKKSYPPSTIFKECEQQRLGYPKETHKPSHTDIEELDKDGSTRPQGAETTSWIAKMTLSDSSNSDVSLDPDDIMPYRFEPRHELEEPHNTEEEAAVPGFAGPWNLAAVPMAVCRRC
ncbi:Hypp3498 [Branchiostoma lanceolatum]|uniref:Hypp3498 protein n=1 Tax=Branchiostoma lanceolatum TaxID=7740 RepID=A0A8K0EXY0_BRALA|nr:Hypp3498 [Branchiostoma lanceolatum]